MTVAGSVSGLLAVAACARPLPMPQGGHALAEAHETTGRTAVTSRSKTQKRADERSARVLGNVGNIGVGIDMRTPSPRTGTSALDQLMEQSGVTIEAVARPTDNGCPADMALIEGRFCVDRYEASLLEILPNGEERAFSAYDVIDGHMVRAVSIRGVVPQAYISGKEAAQACARSGKRLCKAGEWRQACRGPEKKEWGYGDRRERGRCNDNGKSPMGVMYGRGRDGDRAYWNMTRMNNPELNQIPGTLSKTGEHEGCTNDYGVYDMVGNLHEWVADARGRFQGGYYQDVTQNGDGCDYKTKAHENWYHDYSTGFRCCADVAQ